MAGSAADLTAWTQAHVSRRNNVVKILPLIEIKMLNVDGTFSNLRSL